MEPENLIQESQTQNTQQYFAPEISQTPVENSNGMKPILLVSIFLGFLIFGVGGYLLGMQQGKAQKNVVSESSFEIEPTPTSTGDAELLPSGWSYKNNGECAVEFGVPPQSEPYYIPYDASRQPSITDDAGSGRFWDFPRGGVYPNLLSKLPIEYDLLSQANVMFASDLDASGYVSYAISVSCFPNDTNLNIQSMLSVLESGIADFNQNTELKGQGADTYTISSSKETNRWGHAVVDLTVDEYYLNSGGEPYTETVEYTMFATPEYVYEVKAFGGTENAFVRQTGQQIFDNLRFE